MNLENLIVLTRKKVLKTKRGKIHKMLELCQREPTKRAPNGQIWDHMRHKINQVVLNDNPQYKHP